MNKQKLEELISAYSGEKFADLLFQANFEESKRNLDTILPNDDVFAASQQLGEIKTRDNQKVIVVETKVNNDLSERSSRKKQFDIGKKLLQNNQAYSAGLLVFYDERGAFRLSLVHPKFEGTKRSYNSFKRYTFYVNPSHSNKTFINQFAGASFDTLDSIKEVFSVAKVTYDFFKEYKRLFEQIVEHIKVDTHFPNFAEQNGITINDVAKKLLGQIVFLYFLQRKGWLGAPKGQHVSKGDQNFLRTLFNKAKESEAAHPDTQMNFFNDYLEYLFYDALNKPISDSATSCYRQRFDCQIPFLNGGLFEPIPEYKWQERFLQIPDDIFSNKKETGVLDIFDSYNFTIDENSADDQEVSVDPEMLGKVFENLLEENLRKGTGSFYTPREIVQYMVTESLKQYLRDKTDISEEKIASVLEEYHNECEVTEEEAEKIDSALKEVRVVDPACGSGAFLVGLLQEIAHIRHYCQRCYQTEPQTYYQIKKEIIRDSIYGVDLDGGAVDIARLRFWLSMVVDHDIEIDDIEPLPNLDYKLMQGNSLLEDMYVGDIKIKLDFESGKKLDRRTKQGRMFDSDEEELETQTLGFSEDTGDRIADKLVRHHNEFFAEKDPAKKAQLKKRIDNLESELIVAGHDDALNAMNSQVIDAKNESEKKKIKERIAQVKESRDSWLKFKVRPYFPWRLHFSEVFEKGGFDIVIGNPPYVSVWDMDAQQKEYYENIYTTTSGHYDIYVVFFEKSLEILRENGVLSFITSNKWMAQAYGKQLRQLFLQRRIVSIVDFDSHQVFDSATVDTQIILLKNTKSKPDYSFQVYLHKSESKPDMADLTFKEYQVDIFTQTPNNNFKLDLSEVEIAIIEKIKHLSFEIEEAFYVSKGAELHNTKLKIGKGEFIHATQNKENTYKPYLEGKFFEKYKINENRFLDYQPEKHKAPSFKELFESEKIIVKNVIGRTGIQAVIDDVGYYNNDALINAVPYHQLSDLNVSQVKTYLSQDRINLSSNVALHSVLAQLNSKLMTWYFVKLFSNGLHFYPSHLRAMPIYNDVEKSNNELNDISKTIVENKLKGIDTTQLEDEVNEIMYNFYSLTPDEKKLVRES